MKVQKQAANTTRGIRPRHTFCVSLLLFILSGTVNAAESVVRPGDTIGPHNWQKVEGMVGANLLRRIEQGYTFKIKEPTHYQPPKEYVEATHKYSDKVRLVSDGRLVNYVAGVPFPEIDPNDSTVGLKLAWNFYWRWLGDDFKDGGGTRCGIGRATTGSLPFEHRSHLPAVRTYDQQPLW